MPAPNRPAPVSGPGALSRRTDGGPAQKLRQLPDAKYGEQATYQQDQQGAPLAQTPTPDFSAADAGKVNPAVDNVVPFSAGTQNPGEPVTSGAALGAGPGPESLGISPQQIGQQDVDGILQYMPVLEFVANLPGSSPGSRYFVNLAKAQQNDASSPALSGPAAGQPPVQGPVGPGAQPAGQGSGTQPGLGA